MPNLTAFFSPLVVEFRKFRKQENFDVKQFKRLAERVRDRVIKPLTVRRTRTDIERIARYAFTSDAANLLETNADLT